MSRARPTTSPPPHGAVMKAPAHCMRGPRTSPASIASRSAQSVNARNEPTSRTVVKPASMVCAGMPYADQDLLRGRGRRRRHAGGLDVADEMRVHVDQARQDGVSRQVDDRGVVRDAVTSRGDCAHAAIDVDVQDAFDRGLAGLDVEQPAAADRDRSAAASSVTPASDRPTGRTAAPAAAAPVGDDR